MPAKRIVMNAAPKVIINADDFGWSSAVNEAVLDAAENGVLTSTTIMANMPGFEEAVKGALSIPKLGVGVHLNLLRGSPLCEPSRIPSIVGKDGRFRKANFGLWLRFSTGRIDPDHLEQELTAQVKRTIDAGIKPTHLDSEKHMHLLFPVLWEIVCRIAKRFDIHRVRVAREHLGLIPHLFIRSPRQYLKTLFIRQRSLSFAKIAIQHGLRFTDHFFGVTLAGQMTTDVYASLFQKIPQGITELMCHPGARPANFQDIHCSRWLDQGRVTEYRALIDPKTKNALEESGIRLIHYGEI